ncbi:hypothetical protein JNW90_32320 [Micromonospora sp. STR1s_5]|nr:hypothetical protein [Micromonospora sp. STR1s_5]
MNALQRLRGEARYRSFAHIERKAGAFPAATWHTPEGPREITVWCSNDYLGMGQHPDVVRAMVATAEATGVGAGGADPHTSTAAASPPTSPLRPGFTVTAVERRATSPSRRAGSSPAPTTPDHPLASTTLIRRGSWKSP